MPLTLSAPSRYFGYGLTSVEQARALHWMRRNADSIQWWLLSTPELRRCRFHRYLHKTGRLSEDQDYPGCGGR